MQSRARGLRRGCSRRVASLLVLVLVLASLPATAHAYIDPGYGALFVQVMASGLLGALFVFRKALGRSVAFVAKTLGLRHGTSPQAAPPGTAAPPKE
jgi:hypothetical protein